MHNNERNSSFQNDDFLEYDFENREDSSDKQHLSDVAMEKLRQTIKTKVAGELMIKSSDLERTLHLAGQNMTTKTVEKIKQILNETYHTDEYFLDEIEHILAPYWEDLKDDDIAIILRKSFETFDPEQTGAIDKKLLIQCLTTSGKMPLSMNDFQIIFSMVDNTKTPSNTFDYRQFIEKLCNSDNQKKEIKKKKKKKITTM